MIDGFILTKHAQLQMEQREISMIWLDKTLQNPDQVLYLADAHGNTHYLKKIAEFGDRTLRIVVNSQVIPQRIVTLFFDRRAK
ncbi:DUF4258 domain-containing protein [Synechocystis salina]|uniref:DUF4258 domain-containing protein n=1 Tax=Synechocystis salina LEGE 00031 TaxID=1828736 RepID=A0ABR9VVQ7_9SYNC|nr:DUF4258 domain-containing protein [Synechocystis salina]MBE9242373.1 DUF4258 domain-containing protein [Synechocystis salina LEGE 00041]MBE9255433.1 DUF4258 domain-containing protein [Synechocystis salina LEGE 00031]